MTQRKPNLPTTFKRQHLPVWNIQNWHANHLDGLTTGQRAADRMRNWMGSWTFIFIFVLLMAAWAVVNGTPLQWDPYPYILLNLFLSMIAGLQGAILLIAARRQDAIASALAQNDFDTNVAAKAQIDALLEMNRRQVELIEQLIQTLPAPADGDPDEN